jgi:glutaredoxin
LDRTSALAGVFPATSRPPRDSVRIRGIATRSSLDRTSQLPMWAAFILSLALVPLSLTAAAQSPGVDVYLFWRVGCPHCEREIEFLDRLAAGEPRVAVHKFEVYRNRENAALMARVAERLAVDVGSVPFTVIGDRVWVGYLDDASTGSELHARIVECLAARCPDSVAPVVRGETVQPAEPARHGGGLPGTLRVPLLGEIATAALSLPVLTALLAALDGFNPCAMWVLVFLLGLLAGMRDRARMWLLGGAFVGASALAYLLILTAWLNVMLLAGAIVWVRLGVGAVALAGGAFHLRRFFSGQAPACDVTAPEERRRTLERLKDLAQSRDFLVALGGIVALAFAVNVVEFLCSAGIPAVFTQVLALSALPAWEYAAYLVLYVFVFMLDDLVVLAVALRTLEVAGLTGAYARWSSLAGGVVLLGIGALLIARPEWLSL